MFSRRYRLNAETVVKKVVSSLFFMFAASFVISRASRKKNCKALKTFQIDFSLNYGPETEEQLFFEFQDEKKKSTMFNMNSFTGKK
jgi:hypothetical protein